MGFLDRFKSDSTPGPDALTAEVAARLRVLPSVEAVEALDADTVSVSWAGQPEPATVLLDELRPAWKSASGFDRIALLDEFIEGLTPGAPTAAPAPATAPAVPAAGVGDAVPAATGSTEWDRLRPQLLPALRPPEAVGPDAVSWSFGDALRIVIVTAGGGLEISGADRDEVGVTDEDLDAAATANLESIDPAPEPIAPDARAWVATAPAGLQSSWLLAPRRLLERTGLTSAIAFAPLPGELVVIDPDDTELVRSIAESTLRILEEQPGRLCPLPFRMVADGVEIWEPADEHPAADAVQRTRERFSL